MPDEVVEVSQPLIDTDPASPAPGADDQKPKQDPPSGADEQKPEAAETPEQQQQRRESRRARQRTRDAARIAAAETEARMLREQLARTQGQSQPPSSGEPKREQFESYEDYLEARADWRADQKVAERLKAHDEAARGKETQQRQQADVTKLRSVWEEREIKFRADHKDYDSAVSTYAETDLGELADGPRRFIVESDQGPALLHYLATHDADHERIASLSPTRQLAELAKLEDKVGVPQPKEPSSAPPPVRPVAQGKGSDNGYSENMSDAAYREWRKKHGARYA